jgi:glycosyltransferase involved in cell wall biosynthesis
MNCFNSAAYLSESLDSVLTQTFTDWEVVFWDNQSTDESSVIFNSYTDERFRYYMAPVHNVLGHARNLAVEQARGKWIAFLDCDDLWFPEKLEKQVDIIRKGTPDLGLVYGHMRILTDERSSLDTEWSNNMSNYTRHRKWEHLLEGDVFSELLKENFIPLVSSVVLRSAYWQVGGIDEKLKQAEDYDLFIKISKDFKVRAVQEIVCDYRVHDSNLSNVQLADNFKEAISIVSRYMPSSDASKGIRSHQTAFAAVEIRGGKIISGIVRLLIYGNLYSLMSKAFHRSFT